MKSSKFCLPQRKKAVFRGYNAPSLKRKDVTSKKLEDAAGRKKGTTHIDLTGDDYEMTKENVARPLFKKENDQTKRISDVDQDSESETVSMYEADTSESSKDHPLAPLEFYRNDKALPIYSDNNPDIKEIFRICVKRDVPTNRLVKQKPVRIKDTATFIVNQTVAGIKHPKDLDADDTPGAFNKKESTRFYQVETGEDGDLNISCEVSLTKDTNGVPVSGMYRRRQGKA
ncbi:uncharacterized protein LOC110239267 isoform X3 [Exaiptasia diaphana]|uniref:Uncharacterized protein n=1 Tax=Exaiptasia diaphana TaxID=2652724 RepID=A0A913YHR3_EXADI|nr:uncharacterized protein LOC110239267 isoform X3 [Exaiptasia diaphana]